MAKNLWVWFGIKFVKYYFMFKMFLKLWRLKFSRSLNYWAKHIIVSEKLTVLISWIAMFSLFFQEYAFQIKKWFHFGYAN